MKKLTLFLPLLLLLCLSACGNKEMTDSVTFRSAMESRGYTVENMADRYAPEVGVAVCDAVYLPEEGFEVTFYEVETEKQAKAMCDGNRKKFENFAKGETGTTSGSGNNVKYELTADGRYMVNSSIGNTFIYVDVPQEKQEEISAVLAELGY